MTATAQAVLNAARGELGYREGPNNANKFGVAYGWNNVPYCDQFVTWCAVQAGASDIIPRSAYVPGRLAKARAAGNVSKTPKVGSLACFDFNHDGTPDHIGIVEKVLGDGRIQTIEGNTSSPVALSGSQNDGGGVWRRNRSTSLVLAYIHPKYSTPVTERPTTPRAARSTGRGLPPLVVDGVWGRKTTRALQTMLNVTADGVRSRGTVRAMQRWLKVLPSGLLTGGTVKALQKRLGVRVDGAVGPVTVRALQRFLNRNT